MAAKEYVVKLTLQDDGYDGKVEKASQGLEKVGKSADNLKTQLRQMQKELQNLDPNSKAFTDLSKKAGQLKDQINDASEAIRANAGNAFEGLANNASNLGSRLLSLDFEGVGQSFRGLASNVKGINLKSLGEEAKSLIGGFAQLGKALLANPIFLIGAAIAAVIVNFEELKGLVDGVSGEQEKLAESTTKTAKASQDALAATSDIENILREQGKSEAEILAIKLKQVDAAILDQEIAIQTQKAITESQIEAAKRNKEIVSGIFQFLTAPLQLLLGTVDKIRKALGQESNLRAELNDTVSSFLFDPKEVEEEGKAVIAEQEKTLTSLKNQRAGFILTQRKSAADVAAQNRKAREEELAEQKKADEEFKKLNDQLFDDMIAELDAKQQKEAEIRNKMNEDRLAKVEQQYALEQELGLNAQEKEIAALVSSYDEKFLIAQGNAELEKQLAEQQGKDISDINQKYLDADTARHKQVQQARLNIASDVLGALADITNSFQAKSEKGARRQFEINKAVQIAQALIQTYQSATAAYASQAAIPVVGPALGAVSAGAAILSGLAQVNKIRQTKFEASGGGGGAGGGYGAPSSGGGGGGQTGPPQFNPVNSNGINNRPEQVVKAYVISGAVTSGQEADEKVKNLARLGG